MLLMTQRWSRSCLCIWRALLGLLAEHSSPPRLPTGQVLRTHPIETEFWAADPAGHGHNQPIKPPEHCFSVQQTGERGVGEESWEAEGCSRRERVQTPGLLS